MITKFNKRFLFTVGINFMAISDKIVKLKKCWWKYRLNIQLFVVETVDIFHYNEYTSLLLHATNVWRKLNNFRLFIHLSSSTECILINDCCNCNVFNAHWKDENAIQMKIIFIRYIFEIIFCMCNSINTIVLSSANYYFRFM